MPVISKLLRNRRLALAQKPRHTEPKRSPQTEPEVIRMMGVDLGNTPSRGMIGLFEFDRDLQAKLTKAIWVADLPSLRITTPRWRALRNGQAMNLFPGSPRQNNALPATDDERR